MSGERKLRLVRPGEPRTAPPEPPPDAGELGAALALREALERGRDPLANALGSAYRPSSLGSDDHEALLRRALGDVLAPPTRAEAEAAERLARALDARFEERRRGEELARPENEGPADEVLPLIELSDALRSAHRPSSLDRDANDRLVQGGLARSRGRGGRGGRLLPVTMAALVAVSAMAAGIAFVVSRKGAFDGGEQATMAVASLARARSTQDLFDAAVPFPRSGGESERMDRILAARSADLRANRYARWGVR